MAQKAFAAVSIIEAGYCGRLAMGQPPESAEVFHLLGLVAQALGRPDVACSWFERALALAPTSSEVSKSLAAARGELPGWQSWQQEEAQRERYVLIKPWSAGFFSEVDHVMGWCLFASITGRIPVVLWGEGFYFCDDPARNAFTDFFQPVSDVQPSSLAHRGHWFYPLKWSDDNLLREDRSKTQGPIAEQSVLSYLARSEEVVVADDFCRPAGLVNWIPATHPWHGLGLADLNRAVIARYLRPVPELLARVESFVRQRFAGRPVLAAHVRAGDKILEDKAMWAKIAAYPQVIDTMAARLGGGEPMVFLMTDSTRVLNDYRARYGDRLVTSDCVRTELDEGLHFARHENRRRLGEEVPFDAIVATHCDAFVGNGESNVSCFVHAAKPWPEGRCHLFGCQISFDTVPTWTYPIPTMRRPAGLE